MSPENIPPPDRSSHLQPGRHRNPLPAFLVVLAVSALLFLARNWSALTSSYRAGSQDAPAVADLHAGVTITPDGDGTILDVRNGDTFAWDRVVVKVNAMSDGDRHSAHTDRLGPGESIRFTAREVHVEGPVSSVRVDTLGPDGTVTGTWEGMLSPE